MRALARPAPLILLEATDAPISVRVSFVIRENVNQSPGLHRLLLLRGVFSPSSSRLANVYLRARVDTLDFLHYLHPYTGPHVPSIIEGA